jgi:hypothetical protein
MLTEAVNTFGPILTTYFLMPREIKSNPMIDAKEMSVSTQLQKHLVLLLSTTNILISHTSTVPNSSFLKKDINIRLKDRGTIEYL